MSEAKHPDRAESMPRFRPYPAYKDSGIEWLGEIPAHWEVKRVRHVVRRIEQGWSPDCENREADDDEWGVMKAGCVNRGIFIESEHKALPAMLAPIPELEIAKGDLLMSRASGSRDLVGSVAVVPECRPHLLLCDKIFRLHTGAETVVRKFLAYAMNSQMARWQIEVVLSGGSGLANNIAHDVVKNLTLAQPAFDEQRAIAVFLDRETARIDALVEKKERLIELLQEQRTALITRAVTRGLDPTVPMKDSGVEWLGEIPAHWEVKKLKRLFRHAKRQGHPDLAVLSVYRDFGVIEKSSRDDNFNRTPEDLDVYQLVTPDDLVINKMKAWQGSLGISSHSGITSPDYVVYSPRHAENGRFLHHFLRNKMLANVYLTMSNGIRPSQWRLEPARFEDLQVFIPPLVEQEQIAAFLERETARIDALVAKVRDAIDRLEELRTALISAAVTGKIDVRGAFAEASAAQGGAT